MDNIKVGDIVRLKSGGPDMTVLGLADKAKMTWAEAVLAHTENKRKSRTSGSETSSSDNVEEFGFECGWFSGSKLMKADFPSDSLKIVQEEKTHKDK